VLADSDQWRIVLGNLIRKAREAMPKGGCLSISGRRVGDGMEVSVADTGVGMAPEDLHRIVEPHCTPLHSDQCPWPMDYPAVLLVRAVETVDQWRAGPATEASEPQPAGC
jgi:hypothetical protein